jgi:hypothetical protein
MPTSRPRPRARRWSRSRHPRGPRGGADRRNRGADRGKADPLARRAEIAHQLDAEGPLVRPVLSRGPVRAATGG